jgi:hypothetical protein
MIGGARHQTGVTPLRVGASSARTFLTRQRSSTDTIADIHEKVIEPLAPRETLSALAGPSMWHRCRGGAGRVAFVANVHTRVLASSVALEAARALVRRV